MKKQKSILSKLIAKPDNEWLMVAATPVCNAIFNAVLGMRSYDQAADVTLGTAAQATGVQMAISASCIWVETIAYAVCAVLILIFTVEKDLRAKTEE